MQTFKLVIAYDGTAFHGWQEQPGLHTIEGLFKTRLRQIFKKSISFTGASRTDAGVHALGQVARIKTDLPLSPLELATILNRALPPSVQIRSITTVPETFHPRVNVIEKTYLYHFFVHQPSPFVSRFGAYIHHVDLELFQQALKLFEGTHDFRSFCTGDQGRTTVRTIRSLELIPPDPSGLYQVKIIGPSFLRHMIRRIIGGCFDVALKKNSLKALKDALEKKHPEHTFFVAPPEGLLLHSIIYKD